MRKIVLFVLLAVSIIAKAVTPIYLGNLPKIFGLKFGCSYEIAKSVLQNKYGNSDGLLTNKNTIAYTNISYGGLYWSMVLLIFQYDGYGSYLSRIVFCTTPTKDTKQVISSREYIVGMMKDKYPDSFVDVKDEKGFKCYLGGPALFYVCNDDDCAESMIKGENNENLIPLHDRLINIDVVHYDDGTHSARLEYGSIPFVEEEF